MGTISASRICGRMDAAKSSFIEPWASAACGVMIVCSATKVVGIRAKLLTPSGGHQEVDFQTQSSTAFPVDPRFIGPDHARLHSSGRGMLQVGRIVIAIAAAEAVGIREMT